MHWLGLEGRTALVTGGSSGIGRAIAEELGRCGVKVGVNYNSGQEAAEEVVRGIRDRGGEAIAIGGDVSKPEDCKAMVEQVVDRFGRLDILVNNAGIQRDAPFTELTLEDWRRVIDTNLTGAFLCAQEAVRRFRQQRPLPNAKARGNIIFINSVHQLIPWAGHVNYAASKGGLKLLMETLAQEVAHEKIRVNAIAPGAIRTPINRPAWEEESALNELLELIPYGRIGEPEDVANAAAWLASDLSDYVIGATLFIDGGMSLHPPFREGG
ncbi:MAG: sugar dehydrogenase [Proteobacteria bacterium]|jgi:glucose 1-dehydrogenase|nr:MAG: sugar dehydrogenase [Pseudomonadota bacterium]